MVELNLEIVEKIEKSEIRAWQKKAESSKKSGDDETSEGEDNAQ